MWEGDKGTGDEGEGGGCGGEWGKSACSTVSMSQEVMCPAQMSALYPGWRYRESLQCLSEARASYCWFVGLREGDGLEAAHVMKLSPGGYVCVRERGRPSDVSVFRTGGMAFPRQIPSGPRHSWGPATCSQKNGVKENVPGWFEAFHCCVYLPECKGSGLLPQPWLCPPPSLGEKKTLPPVGGTATRA